jgi:hypothetical protein
MNRKACAMRIFLAILFCMIAERAIAQANFEQGPLKDWVGECAGVIANLISNGPSVEGSGRFCPPVVPPRQAQAIGAWPLSAASPGTIASTIASRMQDSGLASPTGGLAVSQVAYTANTPAALPHILH